MNKIAADETKEIPPEAWTSWCDTFSNGNRGRLISLQVVNDQIGDARLVDRAVLVAIDHDPARKGNDIVVSYGEEAAPSTHVITAPVVLWQANDKNGQVVSLEIADTSGTKTIITFA